MKNAVVLIGPQPPPRHGVSAINEALHVLVASKGLDVAVVNTAPPSSNRSFGVRLQRIPVILRAITQVRIYARANAGCTCYFSLSGGLGLLYETVLVLVAKSAGARIVVHHHSFRYVDKFYLPMWGLQRVAGRTATHVILGKAMAKLLRTRYKAINSVIVLSNSALIEFNPVAVEISGTTKPRTLGLMANLSAEKGLDDFLEMAAISEKQGLGWKFYVAGPFEDSGKAPDYLKRIEALNSIQYLGPVYGEAKARFFNSIDVFVFPTRYVNEAEPLVILEAMSARKPVIAFDRGCISDILTGGGGHVIPMGLEFAQAALNVLATWDRETNGFKVRSEQARSRFKAMREENMQSVRTLLEHLGASTHD